MTQMLILHSSKAENREMILRKGLIPRKPTGKHGNYGLDGIYLANQPTGIYGYPLGTEYPEYKSTMTGEVYPAQQKLWEMGKSHDQWLVAYCGRVKPDPEVKDAVICMTRKTHPATLYNVVD
jgi:hypothetical protein